MLATGCDAPQSTGSRACVRALVSCDKQAVTRHVCAGSKDKEADKGKASSPAPPKKKASLMLLMVWYMCGVCCCYSLLLSSLKQRLQAACCGVTSL